MPISPAGIEEVEKEAIEEDDCANTSQRLRHVEKIW